MTNEDNRRVLLFVLKQNAESFRRYCKEREGKCGFDGTSECPFYGTSSGTYQYRYCIRHEPVNWPL